MKHTLRVLILLCIATGMYIVGDVKAQQPMQYFRPHDLGGLNIFETDKSDTTTFKNTSIHIGGAFVQDWQSLTDKNTSKYAATSATSKTAQGDSTNANKLAPLGGGFQLGFANLYLDGQLADGIRTEVTLYLATVHHEDTWVKNGYLQIDKMLFLNSTDVNDIMKYVTIQVGALEVDYGDQHFRRVDGGNGMDDPFIENYIMDEFATEVGAEFYYHNNGWLAMAGVTDGQLNPAIKQSSTIDAGTGQPNVYDPSFLAKLGYDKQINSDLRFRLTGSFYETKSDASSTLFGGDRAGSHYSLVMANTAAPVSNPTNSAEDNTFTQGRFNPGFSESVSTFMINPFIKYDGLEFFGTYEDANGRAITETVTRNATQMAGELIYRFGSTEQFWIGARYDDVKATVAATTALTAPSAAPTAIPATAITINRIEASLGWFLIPSVMMKAEYVSQQYNGYSDLNILNGGSFNGVVVEAAVGF